MTLSGILTAAGAVLTFAAAIINRCRKTKPTNQQLTEKAVHDARAASATGDTDKVNAIVERTRVQRQLMVPVLICLILSAGCSGCSLLKLPSTSTEVPPDVVPATIVVPADRYMYPMTNDQGVVGWFVPSLVHAEMMEAVILVDFYRKAQKGN